MSRVVFVAASLIVRWPIAVQEILELSRPSLSRLSWA